MGPKGFFMGLNTHFHGGAVNPSDSPLGKVSFGLAETMRHEVSSATGRHRNTFFIILIYSSYRGYKEFHSCTVLDIYSSTVALIFSS